MTFGKIAPKNMFWTQSKKTFFDEITNKIYNLKKVWTAANFFNVCCTVANTLLPDDHVLHEHRTIIWT